jgi:hypothetical protein
MYSPILAPLMALVLWSFVMWAWLYATRLPVVIKNPIGTDPNVTYADLQKQIPPLVRWKADNYNNLMEQPTLFYAVALVLAVIGEGGGLNAGLAWLYVVLRVAHSLVHAIVNVIVVRWAIFMAASVVLLVLSLRAALVVFARV